MSLCKLTKLSLLSFFAGAMMVGGIWAYKANKYQIDMKIKELADKTRTIAEKFKGTMKAEEPLG